jgi:hypothetical protein
LPRPGLQDFGALYMRYLEHCLADLQGIDARDAHEKISGPLYGKTAEDAVAAGFVFA